MTNNQIYLLFALVGLLLIMVVIYQVRLSNVIAELADVKDTNLKLATANKPKSITSKNNATQ